MYSKCNALSLFCIPLMIKRERKKRKGCYLLYIFVPDSVSSLQRAALMLSDNKCRDKGMNHVLQKASKSSGEIFEIVSISKFWGKWNRFLRGIVKVKFEAHDSSLNPCDESAKKRFKGLPSAQGQQSINLI